MPGADARLQSWGGLAPLRIVVAPLFALMFFVSALFAPARGFRVALFVAALVEAAVSLFFAVSWLHPLTAR